MSTPQAYGWTEHKYGDASYLLAGTLKSTDKILGLISTGNAPDTNKLSDILDDEKLCFGLIINTESYAFGLCDRVQSYSVYYDKDSGEILPCISTPPQSDVNQTSVLEFMTSGYVLENRTLYDGLKQIQAGECVFIDKTKSAPDITPHRYFIYTPKPPKSIKSPDAYEKELGDILDNTMRRSLESINHRPILIPLSGGLDSRFILAKCHELGARNIQTFSYGMKDNFEARMAKTMAAKVDIDWRMIAAEPSRARKLYLSQNRQEYSDFATGFSRIPSYVEFEAFNTITENKVFPHDSVIINGQAGDYISGGHIPKILSDADAPSHDDMMQFILDKHFSLWAHLKTPDIESELSRSIENLILQTDPDRSNHDNLFRQYESFEWQERQCKIVANGQKTYDYFGFDWRLPLWDKDLIDFFEALPWDLKFGQKLFKSYLKSWNYKGMFDAPSAEPVIWRKDQFWIVWVARLIGLTKGKSAKADFYKKISYYGDFYWQHALYGKDAYDEHYKSMRNIISLAALQYLEEHNIDVPKGNGTGHGTGK